MKTAILTPAQSIEARENLNLQQPVVVSGIKSQYPDITFTKTYLSEFESGSRNLPTKTLRALRDYYETEGHEFSDMPEAANDPQPGEQVRVVRDAVVVSDRLTHSQRGAIQDRVRGLLAGLQESLRKKAAEGIIDPYDDETDLARDRAIAVFGEIGVLYTVLFNNCPLNAPSEAILNSPRKAETISDVLSIRFAEALKFISDTDQNTRSKNGSEGASGSGSDDPALDGDGTQAATPLAANSDEKPNPFPWVPNGTKAATSSAAKPFNLADL